jgi:hypothetical protein
MCFGVSPRLGLPSVDADGGWIVRRSAGFLVGLLTLAMSPLASAGAPLPPVDDPSWTTRYDEYFRKYTKHYFGVGYDWRWFKAQAIAESTLNPNARSRAGAVGLMQILPSTFREIRRSNPSIKGLQEPRWNIAAGIHYDRYLYKRWGKRFGRFEHKLDYTFGSYNAGFGGMSKAYRKAGDPSEPPPWEEIAPHAPRETRGYVAKINGLMANVQAARQREEEEREERARLAAAESDTKALKAAQEARRDSLRDRILVWFGKPEDTDGALKDGPETDVKGDARGAEGATDTAGDEVGGGPGDQQAEDSDEDSEGERDDA